MEWMCDDVQYVCGVSAAAQCAKSTAAWQTVADVYNIAENQNHNIIIIVIVEYIYIYILFLKKWQDYFLCALCY